MSLFLTLLLSHLVADFPLQWNALVRMKQNGQLGLLLHALIHVGVATLLLQNPMQQLPLLLTLGLIHWLIDWTKVSLPNTNSVLGFLADQAAHLLRLLLIISSSGFLTSTGPVVVLPQTILYPAVMYGAILGTMVFIWVWSNTLSEDVIQSFPIIQWTRAEMLLRSQQLGMAFVGALAVGLYYYYYGSPLF